MQLRPSSSLEPCSFLLALVLASPLASGQTATPSPSDVRPTHSYAFHERVEYELDGSRVLVHSLVGHTVLLQRLRAAGVPVVDAEEVPYDGWWLVLLPAATRNADQLGAILERMLAVDALTFASPVFEGAVPGTWLSPTPEILMRVEPGTSGARRAELLAGVSATAAGIRDLGGMQDSFRMPVDQRNGFDVLRSANGLVERGGFDYAEPNMMFTGRGDETPNDPLFPSQWALDNVGQAGGVPGVDMDGDVAFDNGAWGPPAIVVIFDTGVELTHPDLFANVAGGGDFTTGPGGSPGGGPVNACDNHGTAVAGCISAIKGNGIGTAGLAYMCSFLSARCFVSNLSCDGSWTTLTTSTVDALGWAVLHGAAVSNNSNHYGSAASSAISAAYATARTNGMVHFAAAGNFNSPSLSYPASLTTVNAVSAIDPSGNKASFSSYGTGLAFSAPGVGIATTDRTGAAGYVSGDSVFIDGTSFASPLVAAVAALYITFTPGFPTPAQVEAVLQSRSKDLGPAGYDTTFGWGVPNAAQVVAPVGYQLYGTGTSGCLGPQTHSGWPEPHINAPMVLTCNDGPPGTPGLLLIGFTQDVPGTLLNGVLFHMTLNPYVSFGASTNATGDCSRTVSIPNDPGLVGVTIYSQFFWAWPSSTCVPSSSGVSSSNGLAITIQ